MTYTNKEYTKTEIIDALHIIQDICNAQESCENCPFTNEYEDCKIQLTSPSLWSIRKATDWRALD